MFIGHMLPGAVAACSAQKIWHLNIEISDGMPLEDPENSHDWTLGPGHVWCICTPCAARYTTWLVNKLTPTGVIISSIFYTHTMAVILQHNRQATIGYTLSEGCRTKGHVSLNIYLDTTQHEQDENGYWLLEKGSCM